MKILHTVESYCPSIGGMQEVVRQLSERLVRSGHDVTVATSRHAGRKNKILNGVKVMEFNISGNIVRGLTGESENYKNFLLNSDFDIITNFAAQQWATDIAFSVLDQIKAKKVFVPTGFSGLYLKEYGDYFEQMINWMKKYDMNIFPSNNYRDINFARENGITDIMIIPNGADEDEFLSQNNHNNIKQKLNIPDNYSMIVHVGSHTGVKGHREAIQIFKKAKIRNAAFLIIGNSFGGGCTKSCNLDARVFALSPQRLLNNKQLIIESLTREETVSAYKDADLFLFTSNIECSPLVLFECMASKTPFLTTDVGNAAEIIEWSKAGLLLPTIKDPNGFSKANIRDSVRILENISYNSEQRNKMGEAGFEAWQKRFTWEKIAKDYGNLYSMLLGINN